MRTALGLVLVLAVLTAFVPPARADVIIPTRTAVFFDKDGVPFNQSVDFTVTCYGYNTGIPPVKKDPGTYTPTEVFRWGGNCPTYGCEVVENFYLTYRHIDYCDLEAKAGGQTFRIPRYSSSPVDSSSCKGGFDGRQCTLRFDLSRGTYLPSPVPTAIPSVPPAKSPGFEGLLGLVTLASAAFLARGAVRRP